MKKHLKKIGYGLSTVLGLGRYGFFIPYRYAASTTANMSRYPNLEELFGAVCEAEFANLLAEVQSFKDDLTSLNGPAPTPRWAQDWFPGLDAAAAYALVRTKRPVQILEIGSGHSTRFMMRAIQDAGLTTSVTCVDPAPRADITGLKVDIHRRPVQTIARDALPRLGAGDVLFVDSSHIAMPGGDVDWIMSNLIAGLPAGVYVHFHDIFLPDPYPTSWEWRNYNEQLVVAALMMGRRMTPIFSSRFLRVHRPDLIESAGLGWLHLVDGAIESSLWMKTE